MLSKTFCFQALLCFAFALSCVNALEKHDDCYETEDKGKDSYTGTKSKTASGKTCQNWKEQKPHAKDPTRSIYDHNHCRNPDNSVSPWCYTTDPASRWEYCGIPVCEAKRKYENEKGGHDDCYETADKGKLSYTGTLSKTKTGRTCQHWQAQTPHAKDPTRSIYHHNHCRNPDNSEGPWCYTTDPASRWELCSVPVCEVKRKYENEKGGHKDCFETADKGKLSYTGTLSKTKSGKTCQHWQEQKPHAKDPTRSIYHHNHCRNPDNSEGPWCYTTDPGTRWELCTVPVCKTEKKYENEKGGHDDCYELADKGKLSYTGTKSKTMTGKTCQHWQEQKPHAKDATRSIYHHNHCRNPDDTTGGPWCYTTDPGKRWEFCGIPVCKKPEHGKGDGHSHGNGEGHGHGHGEGHSHGESHSHSSETTEESTVCVDPYTKEEHNIGSTWVSKGSMMCHTYHCTGKPDGSKPTKSECLSTEGKCIAATKSGESFKCKVHGEVGTCQCINVDGQVFVQSVRSSSSTSEDQQEERQELE